MRKNYLVKIYLLLLSFSFLTNSIRSQNADYREVFGDDWNKAIAFERENRSWMEPILAKNHISYPLAIAVVFPELVRYSALRDKMEITLLKALYINLGEDYANFSIGQFQMKPSFAEIVRKQIQSLPGRSYSSAFKNPSEFDDIFSFRKSIIDDLEDPRMQFNYLIAFISICEKKYKTNRKDEISRLKFLATAYNYGIDKCASEIDSMIDRKFFNTKLFKTENYSYSDVSVYWYKNNLAGSW
jgi:hypothetical protein